MSMTQIVSFLDLAVFPSLALVFFLAAFIAVLWNVLTKTKEEISAAANIPLDDDVIFTPFVASIESNVDADSAADLTRNSTPSLSSDSNKGVSND